jgi:hypothetical protein
MTRKLLWFSAAMATFSLTGNASAAISEEGCAQLRALSSTENHELFFQWKSRLYSFNPDNISTLLKELRARKRGADVRFIYLARSENEGPTLFLIKQSFKTDGKPWDFVRTFNNVRRQILEPKFDIYQRYHKEGIEDEGLTEWFHLGPGLISRRGLMQSRERPRPREFFAFEAGNDELKASLLAAKGIRENGTCVDFLTYISTTVKTMSFEIRDLRRTESGSYLDPVVESVELE